MLLLFIVIWVVLAVICGILIYKEYEPIMFPILLVIVGAFLIFGSCFIAYDIRGGKVIEAEITMLEEENAAFEEKMAAVVTDYMKHESETFEKATINSETLTFYVAKYPELKSDSLVNSQIEAYTKNKTQIVELKKELLNIPRLKWLLYFGH